MAKSPINSRVIYTEWKNPRPLSSEIMTNYITEENKKIILDNTQFQNDFGVVRDNSLETVESTVTINGMIKESLSNGIVNYSTILNENEYGSISFDPVIASFIFANVVVYFAKYKKLLMIGSSDPNGNWEPGFTPEYIDLPFENWDGQLYALLIKWDGSTILNDDGILIPNNLEKMFINYQDEFNLGDTDYIFIGKVIVISPNYIMNFADNTPQIASTTPEGRLNLSRINQLEKVDVNLNFVTAENRIEVQVSSYNIILENYEHTTKVVKINETLNKNIVYEGVRIDYEYLDFIISTTKLPERYYVQKFIVIPTFYNNRSLLFALLPTRDDGYTNEIDCTKDISNLSFIHDMTTNKDFFALMNSPKQFYIVYKGDGSFAKVVYQDNDGVVNDPTDKFDFVKTVNNQSPISNEGNNVTLKAEHINREDGMDVETTFDNIEAEITDVKKNFVPSVGDVPPFLRSANGSSSFVLFDTETQAHKVIRMMNNKILDVADGTNPTDAVNKGQLDEVASEAGEASEELVREVADLKSRANIVEPKVETNIDDIRDLKAKDIELQQGINDNVDAIGDLKTEVSTLAKGTIERIGTIDKHTAEIVANNNLLTIRATEIVSNPPYNRALRNGDTLRDLDTVEWDYDSELSAWKNLGQALINEATNTSKGIVIGSHDNNKISVDSDATMVVNDITKDKVVGLEDDLENIADDFTDIKKNFVPSTIANPSVIIRNGRNEPVIVGGEDVVTVGKPLYMANQKITDVAEATVDTDVPNFKQLKDIDKKHEDSSSDLSDKLDAEKLRIDKNEQDILKNTNDIVDTNVVVGQHTNTIGQHTIRLNSLDNDKVDKSTDIVEKAALSTRIDTERGINITQTEELTRQDGILQAHNTALIDHGERITDIEEWVENNPGGGNGGNAQNDHDILNNRFIADQHDIISIRGLPEKLDSVDIQISNLISTAESRFVATNDSGVDIPKYSLVTVDYDNMQYDYPTMLDDTMAVDNIGTPMTWELTHTDGRIVYPLRNANGTLGWTTDIRLAHFFDTDTVVVNTVVSPRFINVFAVTRAAVTNLTTVRTDNYYNGFTITTQAGLPKVMLIAVTNTTYNGAVSINGSNSIQTNVYANGWSTKVLAKVRVGNLKFKLAQEGDDIIAVALEDVPSGASGNFAQNVKLVANTSNYVPYLDMWGGPNGTITSDKGDNLVSVGRVTKRAVNGEIAIVLTKFPRENQFAKAQKALEEQASQTNENKRDKTPPNFIEYDQIPFPFDGDCTVTTPKQIQEQGLYYITYNFFVQHNRLTNTSIRKGFFKRVTGGTIDEVFDAIEEVSVSEDGTVTVISPFVLVPNMRQTNVLIDGKTSAITKNFAPSDDATNGFIKSQNGTNNFEITDSRTFAIKTLDFQNGVQIVNVARTTNATSPVPYSQFQDGMDEITIPRAITDYDDHAQFVKTGFIQSDAGTPNAPYPNGYFAGIVKKYLSNWSIIVTDTTSVIPRTFIRSLSGTGIITPWLEVASKDDINELITKDVAQDGEIELKADQNSLDVVTGEVLDLENRMTTFTKGGYVEIGLISLPTLSITQIALNNRANEILATFPNPRAIREGDGLKDSNRGRWRYNSGDALWLFIGVEEQIIADNQGQLGVVAGSQDPLKVGIEVDGTMTVNGLENQLNLKSDTTYVNTQLALKANDAQVVKLTGTQTVAGVKTFSSMPFISAAQGTNANAVAKMSTLNERIPTENVPLADYTLISTAFLDLWYKKQGNIVFIQGLVKGGTQIVTLVPVGFRPPYQQKQTTGGPGGSIYVVTLATNGILSYNFMNVSMSFTFSYLAAS